MACLKHILALAYMHIILPCKSAFPFPSYMNTSIYTFHLEASYFVQILDKILQGILLLHRSSYDLVLNLLLLLTFMLTLIRVQDITSHLYSLYKQQCKHNTSGVYVALSNVLSLLITNRYMVNFGYS